MPRDRVLLALLLIGISTAPLAETERFAVFGRHANIGRVVVETNDDGARVDYKHNCDMA